MTEIKVTCKKCGKQVRSEDFVLDHFYKMVVCKNCVKDRQARESVHRELAKQKEEKKNQEKTEDPKPAGWDKEDEYLNRAYKMKLQSMPEVEKVDDKRVKYTCQKCKYKFTYDRERMVPPNCPYCGLAVQKVR